jgi:hypothetical protein
MASRECLRLLELAPAVLVRPDQVASRIVESLKGPFVGSRACARGISSVLPPYLSFMAEGTL